MAYVTGIANSMADLLNNLQNACTDNGWTLSGNVLHKGNCFANVALSSGVLKVYGGTGIDGSNNLIEPTPSEVLLGRQLGGDALTFPMTYHVHILSAPDEVYFLVNYNTAVWQWLAFGSSPVAGLPGTGNWCAATSPNYPFAQIGILPYTGGAVGNQLCTPAAPFWAEWVTYANSMNSYVHHGLDGAGWSTSGSGGSSTSPPTAIGTVNPLVSYQPNNWNGETALIQIQPSLARPSSKVSIVCDLAHARYIRNDNLSDGEPITLGADKWKSYPFYKKNAAQRDSQIPSPGTDTGTMGWAIRYDGP